MAEERNQINQQDKDETDRYEGSEEMLYSGVYRQSNG
jgi:hypothetical protein